MSEETAKAVESRRKQSEQDKRATLDLLMNKARATSEFTIYVKNQDGEDQEVTMKYEAIGARQYDKLVGKHPPTSEQRADGSTFNIDTFAPALIAKVCMEPEMTEAQAKEIWNSEDWSRGDLMVLFRNAVELNNRGLDIPFSERD